MIKERKNVFSQFVVVPTNSTRVLAMSPMERSIEGAEKFGGKILLL